MRHLAALAIAFGLLILSTSGASAADNATCSAADPLPPGTYGNVEALFGCILDESHVIEGSLILHGSAELVGTHIAGDVAVFGVETIDDVHVGGSLYFLGGFDTLTNSYIGGDIWSQAGSVSVNVVNNEVVGSVLLDALGQESVAVLDNVIGGDLTVDRAPGFFRVDRNQVGGHFRLTDSGSELLGNSSVSANHVGGRFEISRSSATNALYPDEPVFPIIASENVIQGHAGLFRNTELHFLDNQITGALVCRGNTAFVESGNSARTRLLQCSN